MHSRTIAPSYPNALLIPQGSFSELPPITLGRAMTLIGSGDSVHLRLRSSTISPVHAAVLNVGRQLMIRDLGSHTHVYVNQMRVREAILHDGDQIRMGRLRIAVQIGDVEPGTPAPSVPDAWLWNESGEPLKVMSPVHSIGSHPESDLVLNPEQPPVLAAIFTLGSRRVLRNLGQADAVRVNGAGIQQAVLLEGDVIEFGEVRVQFELEGQPCRDASNDQPPAQDDSSTEDRISRPTYVQGKMPLTLGMPISIDQQSITTAGRHIESPALTSATPTVAEVVDQRHSNDANTPRDAVSAELYERARSWGPLGRALMTVPQIPAPSLVPEIEAPALPVRSYRWKHLSLAAVAVLVAIGLGAWLHLRGMGL